MQMARAVISSSQLLISARHGGIAMSNGSLAAGATLSAIAFGLASAKMLVALTFLNCACKALNE